jgi:hypothetical protein
MSNLLLLQEAQLSAGQSSSCWTEAIYKLLVPVQRIFLFFSSSCKSCRALKAALRQASCHCSLSQDQNPTSQRIAQNTFHSEVGSHGCEKEYQESGIGWVLESAGIWDWVHWNPGLCARSVHVQGKNKKERRAAIAATNVVVEEGEEEKNPLRQFRCNRCLKEIAQACC